MIMEDYYQQDDDYQNQIVKSPLQDADASVDDLISMLNSKQEEVMKNWEEKLSAIS